MKLSEANLLHRWISCVILGESPEFQLSGTKEQLNALSEALMATMLLEQEINKQDATVEGVMNALDRKHAKVQRFEKLFGKKTWPL